MTISTSMVFRKFKGLVFPLGDKTLFLLGIMVLLGGCQSLFQNYRVQGVYHTVQPGQTLFRIADAYGLTVAKLQRVNKIGNPRKIQVGQRLWIPKAQRVLSLEVTAKNLSFPQAFPHLADKRIPPPKETEKHILPIKGFFDWPIRGGVLTSKFGMRWGRHHDGIDIASKTGTVIRAAANGKVVFSGKGPKGYGLMVIIKHSNGLMTVYAHNAVNHVGRSMRARKGQKIALVGSTGRSTGPHLHFEVRNNTHPVNPLNYLPSLKVNRLARR